MTLEERINQLYTDVCNKKATWLKGLQQIIEEEVKARMESK